MQKHILSILVILAAVIWLGLLIGGWALMIIGANTIEPDYSIPWQVHLGMVMALSAAAWLLIAVVGMVAYGAVYEIQRTHHQGGH